MAALQASRIASPQLATTFLIWQAASNTRSDQVPEVSFSVPPLTLPLATAQATDAVS